ncbi:hypothetical protein KIM372_05960 [Bombiscardovia nodaiensis]|uniref:Uncharacterized protein n=1 Tax=Bombiscardovia nodaiensis TaxID=2932181 RepID=A0ABN6SB48_9BIFI|nr:hypothetical protein KIM372_05960 [Bombiscardovia nodaiensis]
MRIVYSTFGQLLLQLPHDRDEQAQDRSSRQAGQTSVFTRSGLVWRFLVLTAIFALSAGAQLNFDRRHLVLSGMNMWLGEPFGIYKDLGQTYWDPPFVFFLTFPLAFLACCIIPQFSRRTTLLDALIAYVVIWLGASFSVSLAIPIFYENSRQPGSLPLLSVDSITLYPWSVMAVRWLLALALLAWALVRAGVMVAASRGYRGLEILNKLGSFCTLVILALMAYRFIDVAHPGSQRSAKAALVLLALSLYMLPRDLRIVDECIRKQWSGAWQWLAALIILAEAALLLFCGTLMNVRV